MKPAVSHDDWCTGCGHDVIGILSIGLRKAIGSSTAGAVSPDILERSLRLAYERAYFQVALVPRSPPGRPPTQVIGSSESRLFVLPRADHYDQTEKRNSSDVFADR